VQAVIIVLTCGGYLGASSLLILLNKFLLSKDGFAFPLMLSGSGMLMSFIGTSFLVKVPALVPERQVRCSSPLAALMQDCNPAVRLAALWPRA
jgi:hypothetical protein